MNNETPTPETDALAFKAGITITNTLIWNHARKLERERDEARLAYKHAVESENRIYKERDELREQNQTLRNAQKACEDCDAPTMDEVKQLRKVADELVYALSLFHDGKERHEDCVACNALASYNNLPHKKGQP